MIMYYQIVQMIHMKYCIVIIFIQFLIGYPRPGKLQEFNHLKIIQNVSDVLGSAIGYELHGSEFVKRLQYATVVESSHRLKEKINCSKDAINNLNIKIREERHEATKLRGLETISEEGKEKFAVIADRIQQNVEKMLLEHTKESKLFRNIQNNSHMYFVHSYEFIPVDKNVISATTDYSTKVVCSVEKENLFGTQFHPEKSDKIGLKIIDNFINL